MKNLMIVDMQEGFINDSNRPLIEKINAFLRVKKFEHVIYTRFYNHEESPFVQFLDYRNMLEEKDTEICVDVVEDSYIFPKISYGLAPQQLNFLKEKGIDEVVLCGNDIDSCVLAIAFNLFDYGIRPYFKWKLCGTKNADKTAKSKVKSLLMRNFGKDCII